MATNAQGRLIMGQAQQKRRAVLIVEDDAELRHLMAALFEDERVDTIECESAEAALATLLIGGREVAMIFADVRLRGVMDGIDLAREVKMRCRFQACSLRTIEIARKQGLLEPPSESSRIFGITWRFGRSFQIEAIEHRGHLGELLDQRSNQAQEFLLLWPVASCNEEGSDLNVGDLAARRKGSCLTNTLPVLGS